MIFDIYFPFESKGRYVPGIKACSLNEDIFMNIASSDNVEKLITNFRGGMKDAKIQLPAICWNGKSTTGRRKAEDMRPTQYFMVDVDHCDEPRKAWEQIKDEAIKMHLAFAHITPSGRGLRLVFKATEDFPTVEEHMHFVGDKLKLSEFGDFDTAVKDLSRLSFIPKLDDVLFRSPSLFEVEDPAYTPIKPLATEKQEQQKTTVEVKEENVPEDVEKYMYRGHRVADIIAKYMEIYGEPCQGERHNFYNQLVKYFRCICDNNPYVLNALLPRFGHTEEETLSQCQSICRTNTVGRLPREFFLFLVKNGFYDKNTKPEDEEEEVEEKAPLIDSMPALPPVFREIVATAPKDFKIPCINALMPIMGTLTSYLRADYPLDAEEHATSFFSIIYAPSGAGKSFVKRFVKQLLSDLALRDKLCDQRDSIYNSEREIKSGNEKGPKNPHTQLRLCEPKISETELLEKQANNQGHHMFTYAAEIDQWAKGARAAGGNKDDMLRIAWDGGEYGQHYRSANSFKGKVNLFWNILMTGTEDQMRNYFKKNAANGLVQRCCFTEIENQRFSGVNIWKKISAQGQRAIERFKARCDERCYSTPLDYDMSELEDVNEEDFDKVVPWKYSFKPFTHVDMDFLWPTINKFIKEQLDIAKMEQSDARDSWRKRSAVRGFRLGMVCTQCWDKIGAKEKKIICDFVSWWMRVDVEASLKPFADEYNEINGESLRRTKKQSLYDACPDNFSWTELQSLCLRNNVRSRVRNVICEWKKMGIIQENEPKQYTKIRKS